MIICIKIFNEESERCREVEKCSEDYRVNMALSRMRRPSSSVHDPITEPLYDIFDTDYIEIKCIYDVTLTTNRPNVFL